MGHALARRAALAVRHPATIVAAVLAAAFGIAVLVNPGTWGAFTAMAGGDKDTLRDLILGFGPFAPAASILLNVAQAVLAPIPGFVVPFVNGAVFGTWWGMLITWVGGCAAAATCFGISRTFGRRFAERICSQFKGAEEINRKLERHAFPAIVLARLIPGVPFDFLSYFTGLTRVRFTPFIVATAIGSAPHAYLYAFMGSHLALPLWVGILMTPALGIVYGLGKWLAKLVRRTPATPVPVPVMAPVGRAAPALGAWLVAPGVAAACLPRAPMAVIDWSGARARRLQRVGA